MENISLTELNFFVEKGAIDDSLFASAFEYKMANNLPITADEAALLYKKGLIVNDEQLQNILNTRKTKAEETLRIISQFAYNKKQQEEARIQEADVTLR